MAPIDPEIIFGVPPLSPCGECYSTSVIHIEGCSYGSANDCEVHRYHMADGKCTCPPKSRLVEQLYSQTVPSGGAPDVGFKKVHTQETNYATGARRDGRRGKGAFHWMPWDALFLVSRIYEEGNIGRSADGTGNDRNWENGMPLQDLVQSALNHITAFLAGDRSEPHLPQAVWNLLNAITMGIWIHMGWRDESLNRLPNHRASWKPGDPSPSPLSPQEIEWLKVKGIQR